MPRPAYALLCFLLLSTQAGWATGAPAPIYPDGVSRRDVISGLYQADAGWCCWVGKSAVLELPVPAGANTVVVTFLIPSFATVPSGTAIAASLDGRAVPAACCFHEGVYQAAFGIPTVAAKDRRVMLRLTPSTHFVPAQRGMNSDRRTLSILLQSVVVEDTVTGQRYSDGVPIVKSVSAQVVVWYLIVVLTGLVTLVLSLRRAALGWVMLLVTAPFGFAGVTMLCVAAAFLWQRLSLRPLLDRRMVAMTIAFAVLVLVMLLSASHAAYRGAALSATMYTAAYFPAFVIAAFAYRVDPDPKLLRSVLAYVTIVVAALALAQLVYGSPESLRLDGHTVRRVAGVLEGPNQLGAFLGLTLPLLLALVLRSRVRAEELAAFAIGGIALVLTFSRAGLAACILACALVLLFQLPRPAIILGAVAALWLTVATAVMVDAMRIPDTEGTMSRLFPERITDPYNGGLGTRDALWHGALAMWRAHQLLGVGPGNYELEISQLVPGVRTHPNNYYLQALAEDGVLGLLAFLLLIGTTVLVLYGRSEALCIGVLAVVIAFAFHQLLDGLLMYPKVGNMYWILVGLATLPLAAPAAKMTSTWGVADE